MVCSDRKASLVRIGSVAESLVVSGAAVGRHGYDVHAIAAAAAVVVEWARDADGDDVYGLAAGEGPAPANGDDSVVAAHSGPETAAEARMVAAEHEELDVVGRSEVAAARPLVVACEDRWGS